MKEVKINWFIKALLRCRPKFAIKLLVRQQGIRSLSFDKLHDILAKTERIDIFPYQDGSRGFMIVLNKEVALYFNQGGDHFVYDGFEVGKYGGGDVTIFDGIEK